MRAASQRGFALVVVLWSMALLGVLGAGFVSAARVQGQIAVQAIERARALGVAEAAVLLATLDLLGPEGPLRWRPDGTPVPVEFGGATATVAVRDERGRVDLNHAPPALLGNLLMLAGAEPAAAEAVAEAALLIRGGAQTASAGPAPAGAAPRPAERREAPPGFATVLDLLGLPGMTPALFRAVHSHVTVFGGGPGVNPLAAAPEVLRAIPGLDPGQAERLLELRGRGVTDPAVLAAGLPALAAGFLDSSGGETYTVSVYVVSGSGARMTAEMVIWLRRGGDPPVLRLDHWEPPPVPARSLP